MAIVQQINYNFICVNESIEERFVDRDLFFRSFY